MQCQNKVFIMLSEKFVKNFHDEKQSLLKNYFSKSESSVSQKIDTLNLSQTQSEIIKDILDDVVTDTMYTILLGLTGSASIGTSQETYKIFDEEGHEIDNDEIEEYAWSYFQE